MSLPKLEVPVYTTELPSTNERVEYRPFLVKEQKKLLIALNGDLEQQVNAVNELVAKLAVPIKLPVNDPLHEPVFDKNWSTRFAVTINEGIPGTTPKPASACNRTLVSGEYHIIW